MGNESVGEDEKSDWSSCRAMEAVHTGDGGCCPLQRVLILLLLIVSQTVCSAAGLLRDEVVKVCLEHSFVHDTFVHSSLRCVWQQRDFSAWQPLVKKWHDG